MVLGLYLGELDVTVRKEGVGKHVLVDSWLQVLDEQVGLGLRLLVPVGCVRVPGEGGNILALAGGATNDKLGSVNFELVHSLGSLRKAA